MNIRALLSLCLALTVSACGGGGGGGSGTSISVSPSSVSFSATSNGQTPASQTISATYVGDGVIAGYAPGVAQPDWLTVSDAGSTSGRANFRLEVTPPQAAGTRSTTLRLVTGKADGSQAKFVDVPVSYTVVQGMSLSESSLQFTALQSSAQSATPTRTNRIFISGDNLQWRASGTLPWVTVTPSSGTGPAEVTVTVNPSGKTPGTHTAAVQVTDDRYNQTVNTDIRLDVRAPKLLVTPTTPATLTIHQTTTASDLGVNLRLSDELNGNDAPFALNWSTTVDQPWASITPASGSSAPPKDLRLSVDPAALAAMSPGQRTVTVRFRYRNGEGDQELTRSWVVDLRLGLLRGAGYYLREAGKEGQLSVRGLGFQLRRPTLAIGETSNDNFTVRSDSQLSLNLPALSVGEYQLTLPNALNLDRGSARLVADTPPSYVQGSVATTGVKSQLLLDPERKVLYAAAGSLGLQRFRYNGSIWQADTALTFANPVQGVALAPDGRALFIATGREIRRLDLAAANALSTVFFTLPADSSSCTSYIESLATTDNQRLMYVSQLSNCSGAGTLRVLDLATATAASLPQQSEGQPSLPGRIPGARNGNGVFATDLGSFTGGFLFDSNIERFRSLSAMADVNSFVVWGTVSDNASRVVLSRRGNSGDRLLVGDTATNALRGRLPAAKMAVLSPDGRYAYAWTNASGGSRLASYDLNAATDADGLYTPVSTLTLADDPLPASSQEQVRMEITPDGRTVFLIGAAKLVIVPVRP